VKHTNAVAMKHANLTPRYVDIATWLTVSAFGLAFVGLSTGGLIDLLDRTGQATAAPAATSRVSDDEARFPDQFQDDDPFARQLQDGQVVSPAQVPDGAALPGRAPSAVVARDGDYTPFVPTSIRLPSGRLAPIQPAGVHTDGVLEIPDNPDRVGWWTGGAEAGEPYGTTVLAGHVDSASFGLGFLSEMLKMRPGQELKLGDGKYGQRYLVETVQKIPKAKLTAKTSLFDQKLKHRLVMITCGGPFDRHTHRYRDNVVLVASPIN
jgi:hypothetical protein